MYSYCYVYVFLMLCMFRSRYSVSLCFSLFCFCVNVYCTTAIGCQHNCSYVLSYIWCLDLQDEAVQRDRITETSIIRTN